MQSLILRARVLAVLAPLLLTITAPVRAQVLYGSLTGVVSDASGGAVAKAKVEAINVDTGIASEANTDNRGNYLFNNLQAGHYKVTIQAPSFGSLVEQGVVVDANTVRRVDAKLQLAQVSQSVTVDAAVAVLQTDRADVSNELRSQQIAELPTPGTRNFQSLFLLVPGYSPPAGSHSEAGNPQGALATNVNGASYNNNATRIDGGTRSSRERPLRC